MASIAAFQDALEKDLGPSFQGTFLWYGRGLEKTYFEWSTIYYRGLPDFCLLNPLGPKAAPNQRDIFFLLFSRQNAKAAK